MGSAQYDPKTHQAIPEWTLPGGTLGHTYAVAPEDFATQYDVTPLYNAAKPLNGSGQSIAIINESNININFVNNFRTLFGLPASSPQVIIDGNDPGIDGSNNPDGANGASSEAYLDVEWSGAVAPGATIDLVIAGDTSVEAGLVSSRPARRVLQYCAGHQHQFWAMRADPRRDQLIRQCSCGNRQRHRESR